MALRGSDWLSYTYYLFKSVQVQVSESWLSYTHYLFKSMRLRMQASECGKKRQ